MTLLQHEKPIGGIAPLALTFLDNILLKLGTDGDIGAKNVSAGLTANTVSAGVLVGTPVAQALAANSLAIGNITPSGDIGIYVTSAAGNSLEVLMADGSAGTLTIGHGLAGLTFKTNSGYITASPFAGLTIGLAASAPAPDNAAVHIWKATAGVIDANANSLLVIESSGSNYLTLLGGAANTLALIMGDSTDNDLHGIYGSMSSAGVNPNTMLFRVAGSNRLHYSAGAFAFQEATTISTTADNLTLSPAGSTVHTASVFQLQNAAPVLRSYLPGAITSGSNLFILQGSGKDSGATQRTYNTYTVTGEETWSPTAQGFGHRWFTVAAGGTTLTEKWRMSNGGVFTSLVAFPSNVTAAGAIIAGGGIAFTDVANAWIDDAPHGTGTLSHYIGNAKIVIETAAGLVNVGAAGALQGTVGISGLTSGTVTLAVAAAAGTWTMTLPAAANANAGYQLTCAAADSITSWAAAASLREYKDILGLAKPQDALDLILNTQVYDFHYKPEMGTLDIKTLYTGPVAEEAPWAMHYQGKVVNPVNSLGYMILGFQAVDSRLSLVEQQVKDIVENAWPMEFQEITLKRQIKSAITADPEFRGWLKKELEV